MARKKWFDLGVSICALAAISTHGPASAQSYPQKPVRIVVGVPLWYEAGHGVQLPFFRERYCTGKGAIAALDVQLVPIKPYLIHQQIQIRLAES